MNINMDKLVADVKNALEDILQTYKNEVYTEEFLLGNLREYLLAKYGYTDTIDYQLETLEGKLVSVIGNSNNHTFGRFSSLEVDGEMFLIMTEMFKPLHGETGHLRGTRVFVNQEPERALDRLISIFSVKSGSVLLRTQKQLRTFISLILGREDIIDETLFQDTLNAYNLSDFFFYTITKEPEGYVVHKREEVGLGNATFKLKTKETSTLAYGRTVPLDEVEPELFVLLLKVVASNKHHKATVDKGLFLTSGLFSALRNKTIHIAASELDLFNYLVDNADELEKYGLSISRNCFKGVSTYVYLKPDNLEVFPYELPEELSDRDKDFFYLMKLAQIGYSSSLIVGVDRYLKLEEISSMGEAIFGISKSIGDIEDSIKEYSDLYIPLYNKPLSFTKHETKGYRFDITNSKYVNYFTGTPTIYWVRRMLGLEKPKDIDGRVFREEEIEEDYKYPTNIDKELVEKISV